jgi:imidazolonepropionase-like amidohydrolase
MRKATEAALMTTAALVGVALIYVSRPTLAEPASSKLTAIHNVRLFDGTRVRQNATVTFDEGGIVSVCSSCSPPEGARVVDGKQRTLLPGLIDAHTHTYGDALERALVFGVTTEIDMFTSVSFAAARREEQKKNMAYERADLFSAGTLVTVEGGHGTEYGMPIPVFSPGSDPQKFIDDRIAEGSDFIKLVYDDGSAFGIGWKTLSTGDLARLIAAAKRRGKLAVVHVSTSKAALEAVRAGADALIHTWGDTPSDDLLFDEIARREVFVIPTLTVLSSIAGKREPASLTENASLKGFISSAERAGLNAQFPASSQNPAALDHARAAVRKLKERRVTLLAGTDAPNPGTAHGLSLHRELELLVESGLTPIEALRSATSLPAVRFGLKDRGVIAKGKRGDLLLVAGDPTKEITVTRNVVAVFKGGREVQRREIAPTVSSANAVRGIVSDFDTDLSSKFGTAWSVSTDAMRGGGSKAVIGRVSHGSGHAMRVDGSISAGQYPWAGAMLLLSDKGMVPVDVRPATGISFELKNAAPVRLMLFASSRGRIPAVRDIDPSSDWRTVTVRFSELGLDGGDIQGILFSGASGEFSFELDAFALQP